MSVNDIANGVEAEVMADIRQSEQKANERIERAIEESIVPQGVEIPKPDPIFSLSGIPLLTKKSISLLKGQAKAGKTTVTAWITANIIKDGINVAWFDTEQGLYYASRTQFWVLQIAGMDRCENLVVYDLKIHKPTDRIQMVGHIIETSQPDFVIIDGIRDLIYDINSPEESTLISTELMRWADQFDCHILTIIHENKASQHARGHLGTELQNKAELVLKVSKNEEKQTVCEPEFSRGEPFEPFAFERDGYGIPVLVSYRQEIKVGESKAKGVKPTDISHDTHVEILENVFASSSGISYADLQIELQRVYMDYGVDSMGTNKVKLFISWYSSEGYMDKSKDGSKTIYKRIDKKMNDVIDINKNLPYKDEDNEIPPF